MNISAKKLVPQTVLIALITAMPLYLFRFKVIGLPTNVFELVLYLSFFVWLIYRWQSKQKIDWTVPWIILTWLVIGLTGAFINPDLLSGLGYWRAYFLDGLIIYWIICNEISMAKNVGLRALIAIGFMVGIFSLWGISGWHVAYDGRWLGWYGFDLFASPNYPSLFLAPIASLSIFTIFICRGFWRYFAVVSSFVMIVALWGSQSRGAVIGVLGGIVIAYIYLATKNKSKNLWVYLSAILVVASMIATFALAMPNYNASIGSGRVATSNNVRWEIWKTSFEIVQQRPILGVGLGNYQEYFSQMTQNRVNYPEYISPMALSAHNLLLNILVSVGIVGLVVFLWWLVTVFVQINSTKNIVDMAVLLSAFSTILLYGLVDTPYFKNDLAIFWWLIISLIKIYETKKQ